MSTILTYPHEMLTRNIEYDPSLDNDEVISDMLQTAIASAKNGLVLLGLAANQIGIATRIILYRDQPSQHLKWLVNPEITQCSPSNWIETEACASLPGVEVDVTRSRMIVVNHSVGRTIFTDWEARAIQHEVDHLNGILITDRKAKNEQVLASRVG